MEKIKVLIVEDQLLVAEDIAAKLHQHHFQVIGVAATGEEALEQVKTITPDLVLMDIKLAGPLDGISTAAVMGKDVKIPVIFLSEYADNVTVNRAKKTFPAAFLTKPFVEADLVRSIDIAFTNATQAPLQDINHSDAYLLRTDSQQFIKITRSEIIYLQADRAYCTVVCQDKSHKLSSSMNHVAAQIAHPDFIRVHRSYIVNAQKISRLDGNMIVLGKHKVQMSKDFRDTVTSRFRFLK